MNRSGRYQWNGREMVKISDEVPNISHIDAWMPKGDLPYFDKSANRRFESRAEKRAWLKENKMREGGIINPDKAPY